VHFFVQIGNMKKEINAIRVKDISQGGLTQGQQTQIARNEQRMAQVMLEKINMLLLSYSVIVNAVMHEHVS